MAIIGDYKYRVVIMRYSAGKDSAFGGNQPGYEDSGEAWAAIDEVGSGRRTVLDRQETQADAAIRIRGLPNVTASDRLRVKATGVVWRLEGVRRNVKELVCEAYRIKDSERA